MENTPLLTIEDLQVRFNTERGIVTAVDKVNLSINKSEIVGIVGESGCGKSVMSQTILRLLEHTDPVSYDGKIIFEGKNILDYTKEELRELRGNKISVIFQDPLTSLNPVYTIGNQLSEILMHHKKMSRQKADEKAMELLDLTGIASPSGCMKQFPHELSGGMQQRVMIAMALACEPKLLIADEPTTALDVTIQAQILELILKLNKELNMAVLFITHDLGIVSEICDSVRVMYLGQIVEDTATAVLFENPLHPYTQGLIRSIPRLDGDRNIPLHVIEGTVPSLFNVPKGCRFGARCNYKQSICEEAEPEVQNDETGAHKVKCVRYKEIQQMLNKGAL